MELARARRPMVLARRDLAEVGRSAHFSGGGLPWPYFGGGVLLVLRVKRKARPAKPVPEPDRAQAADWEIHALIGEICILLGDARQAAEQFERAEASAPADERGSVLAWKGRMSLWFGSHREALRLLDKAVALGCRDALCWRGQAKIRLGRIRDALSDLERALALRPEDLEARIWRDEALRLRGDYLSWGSRRFAPSLRDFASGMKR